MKIKLTPLSASLIALTLQAQVPPAVDPSQVVSEIISWREPRPWEQSLGAEPETRP